MSASATTPPERAARPPWRPTGIALLTLLVSPLVGGVLHAINCFRAHRSGGGAKGSLLLPAVLLIAATLALGVLLSLPDLLG